MNREKKLRPELALAATIGTGSLLLWILSRLRRNSLPIEEDKEATDLCPIYNNDLGPCPVFFKPDDLSVLRHASQGVAAVVPQTIPECFQLAAERAGEVNALCVKRGGRWINLTWSEYHRETMKAARSLIALGLEAHDAVNILGFNSPEWCIANLAAIACGGMSAGVYATNQTPALQYQARHSRARIVFTESASQTAKYLPVLESLKDLKTIVQWGGDAIPCAQSGHVSIISWSQFMELSDTIAEVILQERLASIKPAQCASLIYTSGTTGDPKAVMVSHDNLIWTARTTIKHVKETGWGTARDEALVSYLPLSHIAAQLLDIYSPMAICAFSPGAGCSVYFAEPDALRGSLGKTLKEIRPTAFLGVPRVWEKIQEKLFQVAATVHGPKKMLSTWAKKQGTRSAMAMNLGAPGLGVFGWVNHAVAKKVVLSKIHAALGLDRCKLAGSAAAPLNTSVWEYFSSIGIVIMDMYGMSECSGPQNMCLPSKFMRGTVGLPIPGTEVKIDHVDGRDKPREGEILYRGRHIMMGYLNDEQKSRETIDEGGWLHSGDVGTIVDQKLQILQITGRVKDLIITAGGENIAPTSIEDKLKSVLPAVSNLLVVGDRQKFLGCLVTLHCAPDPADLDRFTTKLVPPSVGISEKVSTSIEAAHSTEWLQYIQDGIDKYNNTLATSRAQRIQAFVIIPNDFSVGDGDLTPTQKLKRAKVTEKYKDVIGSTIYGRTSMRKNQSTPLDLHPMPHS